MAIGPFASAAGERRLADAGRLILGGESFRVRTRAGRDLVMVLRTRSSVVARAMRASGGHGDGGRASRRPASWSRRAAARSRGSRCANAPGWNEHLIRVPAEAVGDGVTRLELRGRYAAFHYWFYQ